MTDKPKSPSYVNWLANLVVDLATGEAAENSLSPFDKGKEGGKASWCSST